jgi:hypothetical protein
MIKIHGSIGKGIYGIEWQVMEWKLSLSPYVKKYFFDKICCSILAKNMIGNLKSTHSKTQAV